MEIDYLCIFLLATIRTKEEIAFISVQNPEGYKIELWLPSIATIMFDIPNISSNFKVIWHLKYFFVELYNDCISERKHILISFNSLCNKSIFSTWCQFEQGYGKTLFELDHTRFLPTSAGCPPEVLKLVFLSPSLMVPLTLPFSGYCWRRLH